jgi:hypothetical protein
MTLSNFSMSNFAPSQKWFPVLVASTDLWTNDCIKLKDSKNEKIHKFLKVFSFELNDLVEDYFFLKVDHRSNYQSLFAFY